MMVFSRRRDGHDRDREGRMDEEGMLEEQWPAIAASPSGSIPGRSGGGGGDVVVERIQGATEIGEIGLGSLGDQARISLGFGPCARSRVERSQTTKPWTYWQNKEPIPPF
jgi:hypothetical protein